MQHGVAGCSAALTSAVCAVTLVADDTAGGSKRDAEECVRLLLGDLHARGLCLFDDGTPVCAGGVEGAPGVCAACEGASVLLRLCVSGLHPPKET